MRLRRKSDPDHYRKESKATSSRVAPLFLAALMLFPTDLVASLQLPDTEKGETLSAQPAEETLPELPADSVSSELPADSTSLLDTELLVRLPEDEQEEADSVLTVLVAENSPYGLDGKIIFNPSPTKAVWMSALLPGLGQIYNRRFWKLPIVIGGFMGLGYGLNWNNEMYSDYTQAFRDITDSDPNTKSYMDFFPPTTLESDLDRDWLRNVLKSRRDYYRRNRDLCIICCVGLYLLCMLDAYVDASLSHFDVSDNLSIDISPALMPVNASSKPALGLQWALNF